MCTQRFRSADAGELQELRTIDGAACQDDFAAGVGRLSAAVLGVLDPNRFCAFEQDAGGEGAELGEWARGVGDAARAQAGDAQRVLSGVLPASVSSGRGVASGVTQRPDLTPDDGDDE